MQVGAATSRTAEAGLAAAEAADAAAQPLTDGCRLAVVFTSPAHVDGLPPIAAAVRARLHPEALIAGVAQGVVGPGTEIEDGPAVSVWAAAWEGGEVRPFRSAVGRVDTGAVAVLGWPDTDEDDVTIVLADPHSYPAADVIAHLGRTRPGHRIVGGLLTPGHAPGRLLLAGPDSVEIHLDGAVGVTLSGVPVEVVVSQGCRPVGAPFVVTRAEGNVVFELGGAPAMERLRQIFAEVASEDRVLMQHGLHVGLVADEYRDRLETGDFLIRGVIGADEDTGTIAVGDHVAVGQTIQFQVRDAASAHEDLLAAVSRADRTGPTAGALLFTCNGRGRRFFGEPDHDARTVADALTDHLGGAFCAGEIGPVGPRSFLHGFTASLAVFHDER
ncbi:MAG: FIST C-terminal domain-containing protein [Actinobacteria bacterium]|nr:FIST C-terminal domain-containing protein [Actinomycetota bacterium]